MRIAFPDGNGGTRFFLNDIRRFTLAPQLQIVRASATHHEERNMQERKRAQRVAAITFGLLLLTSAVSSYLRPSAQATPATKAQATLVVGQAAGK